MEGTLPSRHLPEGAGPGGSGGLVSPSARRLPFPDGTARDIPFPGLDSWKEPKGGY